jgi:hypothetical protein
MGPGGQEEPAETADHQERAEPLAGTQPVAEPNGQDQEQEEQFGGEDRLDHTELTKAQGRCLQSELDQHQGETEEPDAALDGVGDEAEAEGRGLGGGLDPDALQHRGDGVREGGEGCKEEGHGPCCSRERADRRVLRVGCGVGAPDAVHVEAEVKAIEKHVGVVPAGIPGFEHTEAGGVVGLEQVGQLMDDDGVEHPGRRNPQP